MCWNVKLGLSLKWVDNVSIGLFTSQNSNFIKLNVQLSGHSTKVNTFDHKAVPHDYNEEQRNRLFKLLLYSLMDFVYFFLITASFEACKGCNLSPPMPSQSAAIQRLGIATRLVRM